jgi:hypothetical protein
MRPQLNFSRESPRLFYFQKNTNFFIPYLLFDLFFIWMAFILVIGGLFEVNLILIRNCSIFASVKIYPAVCNFSLFRRMNGRFEFSRDVPNPIGPPIDFNKRKNHKHNKKKKYAESNHTELELEAFYNTDTVKIPVHE